MDLDPDFFNCIFHEILNFSHSLVTKKSFCHRIFQKPIPTQKKEEEKSYGFSDNYVLSHFCFPRVFVPAKPV